MRGRIVTVLMLLSGAVGASCSSTTEPGTAAAEFVVEVVGERFTVRLTDPAAIRAAEDNRLGRTNQFPIGPLRAGDGGFNAPWTWHLDPAETRFVDAAIEVCDGRPSYVEQHQADFPSYCPWGARVVARR